MHLEHPGWARSRLALNGKIPKMAILGQKMVVFGHLRGLHGVKWRETLVCQRSTHFSHNIQNSAIYNEKWKNGGPKGFAMPYVNVPFLFIRNNMHLLGLIVDALLVYWCMQPAAGDNPTVISWISHTFKSTDINIWPTNLNFLCPNLFFF